jgi:glycerol-3-phosphate cytidylyltransferase-like family protein
MKIRRTKDIIDDLKDDIIELEQQKKVLENELDERFEDIQFETEVERNSYSLELEKNLIKQIELLENEAAEKRKLLRNYRMGL